MTAALVMAALVLAGALGAWAAYRAGRRRAQLGHVDELAQVRSELTRRLNELFALQELSYVLSESIQLDRIATQVVRFVSRFIGTRGSLVALVEEGVPTVRIAAAEGAFAPLAGVTVPENDALPILSVIRQERLEMVEKGSQAAIGGIALERVALAPLRAHGVTVGALAVANQDDQPFNTDELRLMSTIATHAAIVLANGRFFDQIRLGKEQWETTFDALTEGIALLDEEGRIRRANRALAQMLARPLPAVIGADLNRELFKGGPDLPALLDAVRRGLLPPPITVPGGERIARITAAQMRQIRPEGWTVVMVEDVTEQKALERHLIQAEKMVTVGQLVSGVAHELNNPLTSIAGLSEFLLEQTSVMDRDREHLRVINEQAERAGRLVRNLLTFARKDHHGTFGPVDLNDVARRTIHLIEHEIRLRHIQLESQLAQRLPAVNGDASELQQVVLNLLTNAMQALAESPPDARRRITVWTGQVSEEVVLRVSDTGPGIPPATVSRLFTPFFTTKESGKGTGLGLSIAFGIAERHGGRLELERSTGGATFALSLPAMPAEQHGVRMARRVSGATRKTGAAPAADTSRRAILLVDEDPAMQRMIRALFSREHQTVATPPTATDAIRLLETGRYDLIIADPRAAVSAGETFADVMLRRWPEHRGITIMVTADVRQETHEWLRRMGVAWLQKPFKISDLRAAAELVWEHDNGAPDVAGAPDDAP